MGMIDEGLEFLRDQQETHLTQSVIATRGGASQALPAMVADIEVQNTSMHGVDTVERARQFIVAVNVWPFAGVVVGDVISQGGIDYEVNRVGGGDCWRYADASNLAYRIFAKAVSE